MSGLPVYGTADPAIIGRIGPGEEALRQLDIRVLTLRAELDQVLAARALLAPRLLSPKGAA